jgi:hypothetical protein
MNDTDTQPWYRQFWPWFIIALPATAVVASLYTVSLAYRTTDSLVVDAEDGVDVVTEQILAAERRAQELGLVATVRIDTDSGAITVGVVSDEDFDSRPAIELTFSHPTDASRDRVAALSPALPDEDGSPRWSGHVVDLPAGRWYLVLTDGDSWRMSGTWRGASDITLRPNRAGDGA